MLAYDGGWVQGSKRNSCLQPKPFDYEVSPVAKGVGRAGGTLYLFGGNEKSHCKEVSAERDGGLLPFL